MRIATAIATALLLAACGGAESAPTATVTTTTTITAAPTTTPTLWRYEEVATLRIALTALEYECRQWQAGDWLPFAAEGATCGDDAMGIYVGPDTLARSMEALRITAPDAPIVYGDNWMLVPRPGADCEQLAHKLAGACDRP